MTDWLDAMTTVMLAQEGLRAVRSNERCQVGDRIRKGGEDLGTIKPGDDMLSCDAGALCCFAAIAFGGRPEAYAVLRERDKTNDA